jgi:solute carrier family 25 carnitine/acylcarnitine transporter 20/29
VGSKPIFYFLSPRRILTTPIELIKIQQQKQQQLLSAHQVALIPPARTVGLQIFRAGGVNLLYRGLTPTILRDVVGYGLYFLGVRSLPLPLFTQLTAPHTERKTQYEGTLRFFAPPARPDEVTATPLARPWAPLLLAGGVAGILGWIVTFPFDVLKTRMQAVDIPGTGTGTSAGSRASSSTSSAISQRPFPPPGTWRTARTMYAEPDGGPRIFWRGLMPTIIRAVPVNMAVFGTFEAVVWAFS